MKINAIKILLSAACALLCVNAHANEDIGARVAARAAMLDGDARVRLARADCRDVIAALPTVERNLTPTGSGLLRVRADSPLMKGILDAPVPRDLAGAYEQMALLDAAGYRNETAAFAAYYGQQLMLEHAGVRYTARTIREALTHPLLDETQLRVASRCVLNSFIQLEPPLQGDTSVDVYQVLTGYSERNDLGNGVWRIRHGNQNHVGIVLPVRYRGNGRFSGLTLGVRFAHSGSGEITDLPIHNLLWDGSPSAAYVFAYAVESDSSVRMLKDLLKAHRGGAVRMEPQPRSLQITDDGRVFYTITEAGIPLDTAAFTESENRARKRLTEASCIDKGECALPQGWEGLTSPYLWLHAQLLLSALPMMFFGIGRRRSKAFWVYAVYWLVFLLYVFAAHTDRPTGQGYAGVMPTLIGLFASLPWSFSELDRSVGKALGSFYRKNDVDLVMMAMLMGLNQLILGLVAFARRARVSAEPATN